MWKKIITLMLLAVFICYPLSRAWGQSAPDISVVIDGQKVEMSPAPYISKNRTMVPLRFILEAPGVGGNVGWDGVKRTITIDQENHHVVLTVNSRLACVDGAEVTLDVAPVIKNGRTFVPLRFMAERLGALVGWSDINRQAIVNFRNKPEVWGYYYYSGRDELYNHSRQLTDVVFRWLVTDGQGNISYEYTDDYSGILSLAKQLGYRRHLSVMLFDRSQLHELLSSPENRANFVANLKQMAIQYQVEGVNLDLEMIAPADHDGYINLCRELKAALPDLVVSAAVMAHTGRESWASAYDYGALSQLLDRVMIMAYDEHWSGSEAGAVAPFNWVIQVIDYARSQVYPRKLMLGLPAYGYDWPAGSSGRTFDQKSFNRLLASGNTLSYGFSTQDYSPYIVYQQNGVSHQVWYENYQSLNEKWNLVLTRCLSGVFFWRLGGELDAINQVLPTK